MIRPALRLNVYESLVQSKHAFAPCIQGKKKMPGRAMPVTGFCMLQPLKCENRKNSSTEQKCHPKKVHSEKPLQIKNRNINECIFEVRLCTGHGSACMQVTKAALTEFSTGDAVIYCEGTHGR